MIPIAYLALAGVGAAALFSHSTGNSAAPINHETNAGQIASLKATIADQEKYLANLIGLRDNADTSTDPGVYQDEINATIYKLNSLGSQLNALENP